MSPPKPALPVYTNPSAKQYSIPPPYTTHCRALHQQLPNFTSTPLQPLPDLAASYGIRALFVKKEGTRAGLPAYKILGASWATFRTICEANNLPLDSSLATVKTIAQQRNYTLIAATAGNHGRAVARMARLLDLPARIFVGSNVSPAVVAAIRSEGAKVSVTIVDGFYGDAVGEAARVTQDMGPNALQIQDFAFDSYTTIPAWHVEGYGALFVELEEQLLVLRQDLKPTHIVVPIGGGTLGHAAVEFAKSRGEGSAVAVLAIEPTASPCLQRSLQAGRNLTLPEEEPTVMNCMACPVVSPISWPILRSGVDVSVLVTDAECLAAGTELEEMSVDAGPCGSGTFAGFRRVVEDLDAREAFQLTADSVVVVISTDGRQ